MTVYYDDQQMCAIMDELEMQLPLRHRRLVISRHAVNAQCSVGVNSEGTGKSAAPIDCYGSVLVDIGGAVESRDLPSIGMFGYAVALALDGSRLLVFPLRMHLLTEAMNAVAEVAAAVSESVAGRFLSRQAELLSTYDVSRNGPIVSALIVGDANDTTQPVTTRPDSAKSPTANPMYLVSTHALLAIPMGWTLANGPGGRVVGQA